ncbi:MAG: winged helix-turn-helix domain-containing protein, partial [Synergistaceae bacterium]|nr:winged helix-turn-helix domain-containing protein [Synergistaceae bacterium]
MPVPVTQEIRKPLLEAFKDEMPHSYAIGELFNIITRYIGEDPNEMSSGEKNILKEHIKQARSDLKQHGLISSPSKSTYMITNLGLEVLDDDPESIDDDYLARLRTRGTSEALAESEFAVSPDSEFEPEPESEPELEPEGTDAELESAPEDTVTLEEDIAVPEPDSELELQAETDTELLEDPEGDLDLTGGEEEINTSYTPEENQVIEEEDDKISELEGFEDDDPSEFETNPEPEQLAQEP